MNTDDLQSITSRTTDNTYTENLPAFLSSVCVTPTLTQLPQPESQDLLVVRGSNECIKKPLQHCEIGRETKQASIRKACPNWPQVPIVGETFSRAHNLHLVQLQMRKLHYGVLILPITCLYLVSKFLSIPSDWSVCRSLVEKLLSRRGKIWWVYDRVLAKKSRQAGIDNK